MSISANRQQWTGRTQALTQRATPVSGRGGSAKETKLGLVSFCYRKVCRLLFSIMATKLTIALRVQSKFGKADQALAVEARDAHLPQAQGAPRKSWSLLPARRVVSAVALVLALTRTVPTDLQKASQPTSHF